ncbi:4Fe-4S dicluster domain-containing protein [Chloroflexota bacterium]
MKEMKIAKNAIAGFLDTLIAEYRVFAPVKENDSISLQEIHSGSEALFDVRNSKKPAKEIFFPQSEVMFVCRSNGEGLGIEEPGPEEKHRVIFGIRPCDSRSLVLLDNVFSGKQYQDSYYLDKREKTITIAIGCNHPCITCFCTSVGGGPFSQDGSDLLLVDIGQDYIVQAVTEKGEEFLQKFSEFKDVEESNSALVRNVIETAEASVKSKVEAAAAKKGLDEMFDDPFWDVLHEKCLGCAVCTYLCPTCHCFDVTDETIDESVERVRTWDSCAFALFTLEASGFNPRPTNKERMRQRVMHKFKYFVDNHQAMGCVGCGRCVKECPVNLDIRAVLNSISSDRT